MKPNDHEFNATRIAAKLHNDNLTVLDYTREKAYAILNNTVAPVFCKKVLDENESFILNKMAEFEKAN
jgi:hypothetical protein